MPELDEVVFSSTEIARRGLLITLALAMAGSGLGLVSVRMGMVHGVETALVLVSFLFSAGALFSILFWRGVALQTFATIATSFFLFNLSAGMIIAICFAHEHVNLFVYFVWFFPLLVFNKLVNQPETGRRLGKVLLAAPMVIAFCLTPQIVAVCPIGQVVMVAVFCLSYGCYGVMLNVVTRYREAYIV
jgi:hypothetical protein